MNKSDRRRIAKEEKERRKKLLRVFREIELAKAWERIADEVGPCALEDSDRECYTFDFLDQPSSLDVEDSDEDYPNKIETEHNLYDCD